jgi:hypothetical protein
MAANTVSQAHEQSNDPMHGAAIVNDQGQETPITEDMIETALQSILKTVQS